MTQNSTRTVTLTDDEWSGIDTAIPDVIEILNDVRNVFDGLAWAEDLGRPVVTSMMRLAARAVESLEGKEVHVLDRLATAIRYAPKGETA